MTTITMMLLVLGLALGGSGATALAAQDALPNDPLYGIKLVTEDIRISAANDAQARADLEMEFANRRMMEIAAMTNNGMTPPTAVMERQQSQIETTLRQAVDLDDAALTRILLHTQTRLRDQLQTAEMARVHANTQTAPILDRVRDQLRRQLELTELGLRDPQQFRTQMRQAMQSQSQQPPAQPTAQPTPAQQREQQRQQQQSQSSASAPSTPAQQQEQQREQQRQQQQSQSSASAPSTPVQQQEQQQEQQRQQQQQQSQSAAPQQQQSQSSASQPQVPASGGNASSSGSSQSGKR